MEVGKTYIESVWREWGEDLEADMIKIHCLHKESCQ